MNKGNKTAFYCETKKCDKFTVITAQMQTKIFASRKLEIKLNPDHPFPNNNRVSRRIAHNQQYVRHRAANDKFKFAFILRTIVDWNKLPSHIVEAESLEDLKTRLALRKN